MQNSDFRNANMSGSDVTELKGANMQRSNFTGADLHGVEAIGARFANSTMRNANLDGAQLGRASLVDVDLGEASINTVDWAWADLTGTLVVQAREITKLAPRGTKTYALDQLLTDPNRPGMRLSHCETYPKKLPTVAVGAGKTPINCWTKRSGDTGGRAYGKSILTVKEDKRKLQ
jgi:uncharacterized protein YjbI with pentapeptide repeats